MLAMNDPINCSCNQRNNEKLDTKPNSSTLQMGQINKQ